MKINTAQKWFGGSLLAGIVAYIAYRKMSVGTPSATAPPASGGSVAFTGRPMSFDGGFKNCDGCDKMKNFTGYAYADGSGGCGDCSKKCGASMANFMGYSCADGSGDKGNEVISCKNLSAALNRIREKLHNYHTLTPSEISMLRRDEEHLIALMNSKGCTI